MMTRQKINAWSSSLVSGLGHIKYTSKELIDYEQYAKAQKLALAMQMIQDVLTELVAVDYQKAPSE